MIVEKDISETKIEGTPKQITSFMNRLIEKLIGKDHLLSFLAGIFSNIPISLLFSTPKYGNTCWAHVYFYCWIAAIVFSIFLTFFSFCLTIKVIEIEKEIDQGMGSEGRALLKKLQLKNNEKYLKQRIIGFLLFSSLTISAVIAMSVIAILGLT